MIGTTYIHLIGLNPTAGIILAGGQSKRFGQPKQLLIWRGEPFIRHIARNAIQAGLSPVVVVTGAIQEEINSVLMDLAVRVVFNPDWQGGQSTSIRAGLKALPEEVGGAIFLLSDQPQIPARLIEKLIDTHHGGSSRIVAPQVNGKRANPVLFDRSTFPQLMALTGDIGGRAIFPDNPMTWVNWDDPGILINVNTPEDYQKLMGLTKVG